MAGVRVLASGLFDALHDRAAGDWAVGADVVRSVLRHLPEYRPADLHRRRIELALHAPGAIVARAALDGVYRRAGDRLDYFPRPLTDVLYPRMTGDVVRHLAQRRLEIPLQQAVLVAQHEILERVEHRFGDSLDVRVLGKNQRQLALEH